MSVFASRDPLSLFKVWFQTNASKARTTGDFVHGEYEVTPAIADYLLKNHNEGNRPLSPANIEVKCRLLRTGQMRKTTQGFIVTNEEHPRLNDGQHRLEGVRLTGIPFTFVFAFGDPRENFAVLDTNMKVRTAEHVMRIANPTHTHPSLLATAATLYWRLEERNMNLPLTPQDVLSVQELAPEIAANAGTAFRLGRKFKGFKTNAAFLVGITFILKASKHASKLESFLDKIETGLELTKRDPVYSFREFLRDDRIGDSYVGEMRAACVVFAILSTWNRYVRDDRSNVREWTAWTPGDPLPSLE